MSNTVHIENYHVKLEMITCASSAHIIWQNIINKLERECGGLLWKLVIGRRGRDSSEILSYSFIVLSCFTLLFLFFYNTHINVFVLEKRIKVCLSTPMLEDTLFPLYSNMKEHFILWKLKYNKAYIDVLQ